MKGTELLRLVWLNINQNRFKSIMTSIGIVVGAATIVMVIGIGRGGQMDIADQFAELNAGAIDVSYDYAGEEETGTDSFSFGKMGNFFGNMMGGTGGRQNAGSENTSGISGETAPGGQMPGGMMDNQMQPPGENNAIPETAGNMNSDQMPDRGSRNKEMPDEGEETENDEAEEASMDTIQMLGLKDRIHHKPRELSGGQQQRVAIARALVGEPAILLADEPTGALDQNSGKEVLKLFHRLNEMGNTIVMITHDLGVAQNARRIVRIVDGELYEDTKGCH